MTYNTNRIANHETGHAIMFWLYRNPIVEIVVDADNGHGHVAPLNRMNDEETYRVRIAGAIGEAMFAYKAQGKWAQKDLAWTLLQGQKFTKHTNGDGTVTDAIAAKLGVDPYVMFDRHFAEVYAILYNHRGMAKRQVDYLVRNNKMDDNTFRQIAGDWRVDTNAAADRRRANKM